MAITIPELDNLVRSFYEGRGDQVGSSRRVPSQPAGGSGSMTCSQCRDECSKSKPKLPLIRYVRAFPTAPGSRTWLQRVFTALVQQFKEDQDSWLLVDKILAEATYPQTKCVSLRSRWPRRPT